jgi:hypothetical protein
MKYNCLIFFGLINIICRSQLIDFSNAMVNNIFFFEDRSYIISHNLDENNDSKYSLSELIWIDSSFKLNLLFRRNEEINCFAIYDENIFLSNEESKSNNHNFKKHTSEDQEYLNSIVSGEVLVYKKKCKELKIIQNISFNGPISRFGRDIKVHDSLMVILGYGGMGIYSLNNGIWIQDTTLFPTPIQNTSVQIYSNITFLDSNRIITDLKIIDYPEVKSKLITIEKENNLWKVTNEIQIKDNSCIAYFNQNNLIAQSMNEELILYSLKINKIDTLIKLYFDNEIINIQFDSDKLYVTINQLYTQSIEIFEINLSTYITKSICRIKHFDQWGKMKISDGNFYFYSSANVSEWKTESNLLKNKYLINNNFLILTTATPAPARRK